MKKLFKVLALSALAAAPMVSAAQTVTLDYYFNHEVRKNAAGQEERFHYLWDEKGLSGYSNWGDAWTQLGAKIGSLESAPTATNLKGTDIYIIVDPDSKKESPNPNYIGDKDIAEIVNYVKAGGVLVMLANDSTNVDLAHINKLAAKFGMRFTDELHNHVVGTNIAAGTMMVAGNLLFPTAKKIYMKDVCGIALSGKAKPLLQNEGVAIIATTKFGKGTVLAIADPWFYNEYANGQLPAGYDNDKAMNDVSAWLLKQVPKKK